MNAAPGTPAGRQRRGRGQIFASVWHDDANREAAASHGLSIETHLERCRELAAQGYRPAALSVALDGEGNRITASAWHRPLPNPIERERLARQQATAAVTLMKLHDPAGAWPLFRHRLDPEARSQLIWRSGLFAADPKQIVQRLNVEQDVSALRALILALGEFTEEQLPSSERGPLVKKLLCWYRRHPDPGIHGAIDWLLRHDKEGSSDRTLKWEQELPLKRIDEDLKRRDTSLARKGSNPPDGRRWYVNGQGQTMVLVKGPAEFRMGSPLSDRERIDREMLQRWRIPRSFAIAIRSVTAEEFQRFLKDRPGVEHPRTGERIFAPDEPAVSVTWFTAAQYCNWLSEKEGLLESEWCYPSHSNIKEGMKPYPDYLKRKGYRLPTEAEWEFAARAGSSSSRYYGSSLELLPRYAWFVQNSSDRTWPVGQKRPNDSGLFDAGGNVWNWCGEVAVGYPRRRSAVSVPDSEDTSIVDESSSRALRGGSFVSHAPGVRSSIRGIDRPDIRIYIVGFRVCRTSG